MAKSTVFDGQTIYQPGAYSKYKVQGNPSGLATTGVLMLVGEADAGPRFSGEEDLELNAFGPDQISDVVAKYGSGPLVDAFRAAIAPSASPDVTGSFTAAILAKTNLSEAATGTLPTAYGTLVAKSEGKAGNKIAFQTLSQQAEVVPTTGAFAFIPPVGAVTANLYASGKPVTPTMGAGILPSAFVTNVSALAGVVASGGANRGILTVAGTVALSHALNVVTITRSVNWAVTPTVGDSLVIPTGSVIAGTADENVGGYIVTAATPTTITATKLSDAGKTLAPAPVAGTVTEPANVGAASAAAVTDVMAFSPVTISHESALIDGVGKTLELAEVAGADLLSRTAYTLVSGTPTACAWVSKTGASVILESGAEYQAKLNLTRTSDFMSESFVAGGEIALSIGYLGTSATITISDTQLATTVVGGAGISQTLELADFDTIQDIADFLSSQTGYTAEVGSASLGYLPSSALDNMTTQGCCTQFGGLSCKLKVDAYRLFEEMSSSLLVQLGATPAAAASGLPTAMAAQQFLAGGTKGGTTDADVTAALVALEDVVGNFVIPLFSRDATDDKTDGLTDSTSTYTIDAVQLAAKTHVLAVSTTKRKKHRRAFLSVAESFADAKQRGADLSSARTSLCIQDFKLQGSDGSVQQLLPWAGATNAAAYQAAAFYKNIENKAINTSGVVTRAGDFNPKSESQLDSALKAGLLVAKPARTGGFVWVSDQTNYNKDNNFVFNSIQACYAADIILATLNQRYEAAFVGQSTADISAAVGRSFGEVVLSELLALKLLAPSDGAESGYKNLKVTISGNVMRVSVQCYLATALDFILISFDLNPVEQSA